MRRRTHNDPVYGKKVLENRQLIPPIADQHLIRKLARHYNHSVEVAIITRGVTTIAELWKVLHEFMTLRSNTSTRNNPPNEGNKKQEPTLSQGKRWHNKEFGNQRETPHTENNNQNENKHYNTHEGKEIL